MRRRRSRVIPAVTVALGACTIFVGSLVRGDYAPQVWLDIGAALVLFGPLYWAQSMLERGLREVRQQEQHTRSSVEHLSHEIETIRRQTTASLDDLRQVTLENVQERRQTDEDAFRRFEEAPTFQSVVELLDRARELGAVSERGVRVLLPATTLRLRFPISTRAANGSLPVLDVGIEEEDGTLPHDATADRIAMRGQQPVPWSANTGADAWAASVAPELQKLNRYPGRRPVRPRRGVAAAHHAPAGGRGGPDAAVVRGHAAAATDHRDAERRVGHHRERSAEPDLGDRLHRQGAVPRGERGGRHGT